MKYVPNMLNAGNITGTIKNAFSDVLKLIPGKEKTAFLFTRYTTRISAIAARLNQKSTEPVDSGDL